MGELIFIALFHAVFQCVNALKDSMKQGYEYEFAHLEETESVVIK